MSESFQIISPKPLNLRFTVTLHPSEQGYVQLYDQQGTYYVTFDGKSYLQVAPVGPQHPDTYMLEDGQQIKAKLQLINTPYLELQIDNTQLSTIYTAVYTDFDVTPEAKQKFPSMDAFYDHLKDKINALWKNGDQQCGLAIEQQKDNIIIDYFEEFRPTPRKLVLVEIKITLKEKPLTMEDKMTIFKDKLGQICNQYEQFHETRSQYDQYQDQINKLASQQLLQDQKLEQYAYQLEQLVQANKQKDLIIDDLKGQIRELQTINVETLFRTFTKIQDEFNKTQRQTTQDLIESKFLELPKSFQQSQSVDGSLQIGPLTALQLQQHNIQSANGFFFASQAFEQSTATKFVIQNLEEGAKVLLGVCDGNIDIDDYLLEDSDTYQILIPSGLIQKSSLEPKQLVNHYFQVNDQIILKVTLDEKDGNMLTILINNGQKYNIKLAYSKFRFFTITTIPNALGLVQ